MGLDIDAELVLTHITPDTSAQDGSNLNSLNAILKGSDNLFGNILSGAGSQSQLLVEDLSSQTDGIVSQFTLSVATTTNMMVFLRGLAYPVEDLTVDSGTQFTLDEVPGASDPLLVAYVKQPLPVGYIKGLELTYVNGSTVDIEVGACRDLDNTGDIVAGTTLTADMGTSGANGLDTGSEASSTWYYVWVIRKSSDGTVASLLSLSSTSPTMPVDYDQKRRVGVILNSGSSNFLTFFQRGSSTHRRYERRSYKNVQHWTAGTSPSTPTGVDLSGEIPPVATEARGFLMFSGTAGFFTLGRTTATNNEIAVGLASVSTWSNVAWQCQLISTTVYAWDDTGGGEMYVMLSGWSEEI